MHATTGSKWLGRAVWLHFACGICAFAIFECSSCIAKPAIPQLHVDTAVSERPQYRQALLALLAKSSDPLSVNELHDLEELITINGWPTVLSAKLDGVNAAAVLVLRATNDYAFQEAVENIVWGSRIYVDVNAAAAANWIDRIEDRHNHKQIFGTMLLLHDGKVIEPASLDETYADFMRDFNGLPLLTDYINVVQKRVNEGQPLSQANAFSTFAKSSTAYSNPVLRNELDAMVKNDQDARLACAKLKAQPDSTGCKKVVLIDSRNLVKEKTIFKKYGFPTSDIVGRDGVAAFFLLVQHAITDHDFQSSVLGAAAPLLSRGDLAHQDYALLYDRVHSAHGGKQLYGTQIKIDKRGRTTLVPIFDPINLDRRRRAMAMGNESGYFIDVCKTYHLGNDANVDDCQSRLTRQLVQMQIAERPPYKTAYGSTLEGPPRIGRVTR